MKYLRPLTTAGDTIVEVMMVLAILGLAIGISYATANRGLLATREAQENTKATALLQSQIEQLVHLAPNPQNDSNYIFRSGSFCIDSGGNVATSASSCKYYNLYDVSIVYDSTDPNNPVFKVQATWDDVSGQGQDTATLYHRIYQ